MRIFVKDNLDVNKEIILKEKQFHYLNNVVKCKLNDDVFLINGRDGEFIAKIIKIQNKQIHLNIITKTKNYFKEPFLGFIFSPIQK
jgi:16S rRNA (uracil1498-N3)-methyltransferase